MLMALHQVEHFVLSQVLASLASWGNLLNSSMLRVMADVYGMTAQVRLRVWRRTAEGASQQELLCDLSSKRGAVEVGGGPWWSTWSAQVIFNRHSDSAYKCHAA